MGGKRMILFPFVLIIFSISSSSARALGELSRFKTVILPNGTETECAVYTEIKPCPPGHEITEECDHKYGLMKCSQCKENLYQCDFTTTEFLVKCEPPLCPENGKETKVKVTYFDNKTCQVSCVCNEANGYTGKSGLECNKHPHICGRDKELKNGTCVACSPGFHNPSTDYGPCVSFEPTTPSTSSGSPDQGLRHDNENWILPTCIIFILVFLLLLAVFAWYCCWRGQANPCNIACCNSTAIQNSQTRTQAQESPGDPPPYTSLLDGDLSHGVSGHQPNGIPGASPNGIPSARPNGIPGARPNRIPGARPNRIPGASPNGIPGASPNGIPGDSPNGIPGASSNGIPSARPNGIPGASPNGIPGASPNGIPGASSNGIPSARPNGIPGASPNGIPGASPNGIPGASPNGIPSASSNGIPGASPNGIPGASPNGIPGASSNGIPGASSNGIPGASSNGIPCASSNGIPGASLNGIPGARPNGIPSASSSAHEDAENGPNGSTGRSISGRRTPTGTADSSIRSLEGQPDPLDSGGDSNDHFLGWDPLTSEATSLNLPRQGVQDPEETGRKVPIPAQDIGTGSDDENDEVDDDNEGAQALLDGPAYGLVELDKDRDMSHVPMVQ